MADISFGLIALQVLTGLALGCIFVLVATGLTLIFGMLNVVNFAHGAFYAAGAYIGVFAFGYTGNFWISLVVVPVVMAVLGMFTERYLLRPLYGRDMSYPLLLTFGLGYVVIELIRILFGTDGIPFSAPAALKGSMFLGDFSFPRYRLFVMGVTVLIEAFVITVIGGMGSLPGAIIAGLLMGVVVSITSYFAADFSSIVMFAIMAVILIVRPQGLLGRPEAAR